MKTEFDVIALGELLIDFTMNGTSSQGNQVFEACPGGAPCNVLAMLNKLGKKTAFIGKVGQDQFGLLLKQTLENAGICTEYLYLDPDIHTTLAFVHTLENGDRDFSFYRNPGADMMLTEEEVEPDFLKKAKIFHFGTLSMTHEGVRKATKKALQAAKEAGVLISFDPNLRPPLWNSLESAKEQIHYPIPLVLLTLGSEGSRAYYQGRRVDCKGFSCETIETTGAGDTFCGSVLNYLSEHGIKHLTDENLKEMLTFANAAAALITTRKGAIRSMPEKEEVNALIKRAEERTC